MRTRPFRTSLQLVVVIIYSQWLSKYLIIFPARLNQEKILDTLNHSNGDQTRDPRTKTGWSRAKRFGPGPGKIFKTRTKPYV